jgi:DoxX-like family
MLLDLALPVPPDWLIRGAVASVWLYEGVWCKLLGRGPGQLAVVQAVPFLDERRSAQFLRALGVVEMAIGVWVLSGFRAALCTLAQTVLLVSLNSAGIFWARHRIHDPAGMVLKNSCFLLLSWVALALRGSAP